MTCALTLAATMCHGTHTATPSASGEEETTLHLETFVLNLGDPEQHAYLRVGIDLTLNRESGPEATSVRSIALIRDTILGVLTTAQPDEILTSDGKTKLKGALLQALSNRAPELGVREVYFTEFLVQR